MLWSDTNPWIPGLIRGLLLAIIGAVLAFIADSQTAQNLPGWLIAAAPLAVLGLRAAESLVLDQFRNAEDHLTPDL